MKGSAVSITVVFLFGMFFSTQAIAQEEPKTYSGNIWSRSTLTGDWGGARNDLAGKGIIFDMNLTQVGQGVTEGGKDKSWEYGGRGDLTVNVDTQKLGLWPGGFLTVEVEGNAFNEHGVQIMSPNYVLDPSQPKLVSKNDWYAPPAKPPDNPGEEGGR
jgi:carbohydrate-selective porin OprB